MVTVNGGNIAKGMYIMYKGEPHMVTKTEFMSPGKGTPVMRVKMRNAKTGSASEFTYKTNDNVEVADVEKKEMNYLYHDSSEVVFMNPQNYEQANVPTALLEDKLGYLVPNLACYVLFYKGEPAGVMLPPNVTVTVTESPDSVAGNRVNAPKKPVVCETGLTVQAPIFIKKGEKIAIDTTTGEYLNRVK